MNKNSPDANLLLEKLVELARLSLQFGQTNRVTLYPDKITPESDTDHTFMLGLFACVLQEYCAPNLNRGKVAEYALIHDFVEVYAGDTLSLGLHDKSEKEAREHQALLRIKSEYDTVFPWIGEVIEKYESLVEPEARFIKVLDKLMPGIVHQLNDGYAFEVVDVSIEDIIKQKGIQHSWVKETAHEWPLLIELYERGLEKIFALPYFNQK